MMGKEENQESPVTLQNPGNTKPAEDVTEEHKTRNTNTYKKSMTLDEMRKKYGISPYDEEE